MNKVALHRLANYIERTQLQLEQKGSSCYNQRRLEHPCGAPACALGHARRLWPDTNLTAFLTLSNNFFDLNTRQWSHLFSSAGCNFAGKDWRQAVAYIRDFIANG